MKETIEPEYHRQGYHSPIPTTDIIIEYAQNGREGIVLIQRRNPPLGLAIPGGFAEYGLTLEENARKEAREETGLEVVIEDPERPFCVHSDPARDPRGHMISSIYIAIGSGVLKAGDDAKETRLYSIDELKGLLGTGILVFDDDRIIEKYLRHRGFMR
ncbi:NUDIX hydrolase [Candidatus Woesearchaeota archaeon]|nr:NUDIX hydrolase [Candidatus Woesearchaeota archaeon]